MVGPPALGGSIVSERWDNASARLERHIEFPTYPVVALVDTSRATGYSCTLPPRPDDRDERI